MSAFAEEIETLASKGLEEALDTFIAVIMMTAPKHAKEEYRDEATLESEKLAPIIAEFEKFKKESDPEVAFGSPNDPWIEEVKTIYPFTRVELEDPFRMPQLLQVFIALVMLADDYRIVRIRANQVRRKVPVTKELRNAIIHLNETYSILLEHVGTLRTAQPKIFPQNLIKMFKEHFKIIKSINVLIRKIYGEPSEN